MLLIFIIFIMFIMFHSPLASLGYATQPYTNGKSVTTNHLIHDNLYQ